MDEKLVNQILENMRRMETDELLKIWEASDKEEYSEEAFEAVKRLLEDRGETLPQQKQAETKSVTDRYQPIGQMKPKASKGILYWGAFLMVMTVWPLFDQPISPGPGLRFEEFGFSRLAASSSTFMKILLVSGGVISFALCFFWYRLQKFREQRGRFLSALGNVLFLLGTLILIVAFGMPGQQEIIMLKSGRAQEATVSALISLFPPLLMAVVTLVLSYFLRFKGSSKSR